MLFDLLLFFVLLGIPVLIALLWLWYPKQVVCAITPLALVLSCLCICPLLWVVSCGYLSLLAHMWDVVTAGTPVLGQSGEVLPENFPSMGIAWVSAQVSGFGLLSV